MKFIRSSVILMFLINCMLIIGSFTLGNTEGFKFYTTPVFLIIIGLLILVQVGCLIRYKFRVQKIGFYLCHMGVVIILIGGLVSYAVAEDINFVIPIDPTMAYSQIMKTEGGAVDFGFNICLKDFNVERYEPEYEVYAPTATGDEHTLYLERISVRKDNTYHIPGYGKIEKEELMDEAGYREQVVLEGGLLLKKLSETDKTYSATMAFIEEQAEIKELRINHPIVYKGWKFYLMDYDKEQLDCVTLYAKKDPANTSIRIGIWLIIVGTVMMCFRVLDGKRGEI